MSDHTVFVYNEMKEVVYPMVMYEQIDHLERMRILICERTGVPPGLQRLRFQGQILPLSGWLPDFDIGWLDTVVLSYDSQPFAITLQHAMTGETTTVQVEPWANPLSLAPRVGTWWLFPTKQQRFLKGTRKLNRRATFASQGVGAGDTHLAMRVQSSEL